MMSLYIPSLIRIFLQDRLMFRDVYKRQKEDFFVLTSLAFIFLAGLAMAGICQQLKIPRIIGMLAVGILLGPSAVSYTHLSSFTDISIIPTVRFCVSSCRLTRQF